jgi:hypothetical protein
MRDGPQRCDKVIRSCSEGLEFYRKAKIGQTFD